MASLVGRGVWRVCGLCPGGGFAMTGVAPGAAPPPFLPRLPSLRGSSTQLSPESISVTTPLRG